MATMDLKIIVKPTNKAMVVIEIGGFSVKTSPMIAVKIPNPMARCQFSNLCLLLKAKKISKTPATRNVKPKNMAKTKIDSFGEAKTTIPMMIYKIPPIKGIYQFLTALNTEVKK